MKLTSLIITVVTLGAAVWAAIILQKNKSASQGVTPDELVGQALLTFADVNTLQEVIISAREQSAVIKKVDDVWVVPEHYGLPVEFASLQRLVKSFTDAKIVSKVTANPEVMKRFELASNQVTFKGAQGAVMQKLNIGKVNESGDRFVQFGGEGPVYLMSFSGFLNSDGASWASKRLVGFTPETIVQVAVELEDGTQVVASRADVDAEFVVAGLTAGEATQVDQFTSLVAKFSSISFSAIHPLEHAEAQEAQAHSRVIAFTTKDGAVIKFDVGRRPVVDLAEQQGAEDGVGDEEDAPQAGPVFVFATSDDADIATDLQRYMAKATFEVAEDFYTALPRERGELVDSPPVMSAPSATELPIPALPTKDSDAVIVAPTPLEVPSE